MHTSLRTARGPNRLGPNMSRVTSTREQIIEGAYTALLADGLPNLSYDRIAQAAGTSRQLVRYHFRDPDALMLTLCDRLAQTYRDALLGGIAELSPGGSRLTLIFDFYFDMVEGRKKPRDDQVYDALMARAASSTPIRGALRSQYTLLGQVLANEVQLAHPSLSADAASEIGYVFVSLMYGHWKMVASLGLAEDHGRIARAAIDRIVESYLAGGQTKKVAARVWAVDPSGTQ